MSGSKLLILSEFIALPPEHKTDVKYDKTSLQSFTTLLNSLNYYKTFSLYLVNKVPRRIEQPTVLNIVRWS